MPSRSVPRPPYALATTDFPLPALAAMAGRAPLGGPRELALACLVTARLVTGARADGLTPEQRTARAHGARHWLGATAIPAPARVALGRLVDATVSADDATIADALTGVMTVTAGRLDGPARLELARIAQAVAE